MSGWNNSDRRARLPENWYSLVKAVKKRDGNRCTWRLKSGQRCPRVGTDVDHRRPGDDHRMRNLQLLCVAHHKAKTASEARQASRGKRASKFRKPEKHPGAL